MRTLPNAARATLVAALALAGIPAMLPAQPTTATESDVQALREQIRQLDQKLRVLERNQELKDETAAAAAKKQPSVSIGKKGLVITSPDQDFSLKIGGLVQTDARVYLDDAAPNRDGFLLRRIRLPVSGTFSKNLGFFLQPEFSSADTAGSNTQLVDAWLEARISPAFGLKAGKFFGPVALETPNNRHFIESSFTNQLAPNRDIGFEASGALADGIVGYRLGIYNGVPNNVWSGTTNGADGDFTVGGRLTVNPFKGGDGALAPLSFSVGAAVGNTVGNTSSIKSNGQQTIDSAYAINGQELHVSPAVEWYSGPFSAVAEYSLDRQELALNGADVTNTGWRVGVGYVLTGENSTRKGVSPASPFDWEKGSWGAFEVVARVSGLDVDDELFSSGVLSAANNASKATSYGVGLNWFLTDNVQARFDLEKTNFSGGGATSTNVALRDDEFYLFTRLQLQF